MLKRVVHDRIIRHVDHRNLNLDVDFLEGILPSTENLAVAFWHRLVDALGTLEDAIASAAAMAELDDDFEIRYIEEELDFSDKLVIELLTVASRFVTPSVVSAASSPQSEWLQLLARQTGVLAELLKPGGLYEYAFLEVD